jgi:hypothetical protein
MILAVSWFEVHLKWRTLPIVVAHFTFLVFLLIVIVIVIDWRENNDDYDYD